MNNLLKIILTITALLISTYSYAESWEHRTIKDDFTEEESSTIVSTFVEPNSPLPFPYGDLRARLIFYCSGRNLMILSWNSHPNLVDVRTIRGKDGKYYNSYKLKVKIDEEIFELESGGPSFGDYVFFLSIDGDKKKLSRIKSSEEIKIQVPHYAGTRHYIFHPAEAESCPN